MNKLNLALLLALLASSLYLVNVSYQWRRLYTELDRAHAEERKLSSEHKRLDAEREAQATNFRVEKLARDKLGMRHATPAVTHYVHDPMEPSGSSLFGASELARAKTVVVNR